jgi:hypothetical protein
MYSHAEGYKIKLVLPEKRQDPNKSKDPNSKPMLTDIDNQDQASLIKVIPYASS